MRHLSLILLLALALPAPAPAQTAPETGEEGPSLMERGAELFLRGLLSEMEPALQDLQERFSEVEPALRSLVEEMGPALVELLRTVQDFRGYHPPEILPNGDIILRKKLPGEMDRPDLQPEEIGPDGEVEL